MVYAHLPAIRELASDGVEAVALCEPNEPKRALVADNFGIGQRFADFDAMLASTALDGVVIASPHVYHYQQARGALERGLHVLVEKPMTLRASEARALVQLAEAKQRVLLVDYPWNFAPHARWAKQQLLDGAIGPLRCVASHFSSSAAVLMRPGTLTDEQRETHGSLAFPPEPETYADARLAGGGQGQTQTTHAAGLLLWLADLELEHVSALMASHTYPVDVVNALSFRSRDGVLGTLVSLGTVPPGFPPRHDVGRRAVELVAAAYASAVEDGRPVSIDELA
jgi:predicted dehydrogenase